MISPFKQVCRDVRYLWVSRDAVLQTVYKYEDGKLIARSVPSDPNQTVSVIEREIVDGELVQVKSVSSSSNEWMKKGRKKGRKCFI